MQTFNWVASACLIVFSMLLPGTCAAEESKRVDIQLIHMGGNDCPPCVAWRTFELPKLQRTSVWSSIKFSYVTKGVKGSVPSSIFLPEEVKPLKGRLDIASGGNTGSPQVALFVNGEVYAYWGSARTAEELEKMLLAVRDDTTFPIKPCRRWNKGWTCADGSGAKRRG